MRSGNSFVIRLPKYLRTFLGVKEGDEVAFRKVGRVFLIAVIHPFSVIPVSDEEIRQAMKALGV
jgi:antitoxin component of MazEF toxin-antitoxin module